MFTSYIVGVTRAFFSKLLFYSHILISSQKTKQPTTHTYNGIKPPKPTQNRPFLHKPTMQPPSPSVLRAKLSAATRLRNHALTQGNKHSGSSKPKFQMMLENGTARRGETERLESVSSQRQSNALKLRFRAGRPAVRRIPESAELDTPDRG